MFEEPSPCTDVPRAEGTLRTTLDPSRAPTAGWTITLRIVRANGVLQADGEITDATRAPVAHRIFTQAKDECASLARAVGVWASIVLDTELDRVRDAPPPPPPPPALAPANVDTSDTSLDRGSEAQRAKDDRTIEVGATTFLLGGMGTTAMVGPSIFTMLQLGEAVFMRPAISYGRTVRGIDDAPAIGASWAAARLDFCGRIVGAYLDSRALQLDVCSGAEFGFVHVEGPLTDPYAGGPLTFSTNVPTIDVGPSLGLSGDLNSFLDLELRGFGFVNLDPQSYAYDGISVKPALLGGRVEVALAWKIR